MALPPAGLRRLDSDISTTYYTSGDGLKSSNLLAAPQAGLAFVPDDIGN